MVITFGGGLLLAPNISILEGKSKKEMVAFFDRTLMTERRESRYGEVWGS